MTPHINFKMKLFFHLFFRFYFRYLWFCIHIYPHTHTHTHTYTHSYTHMHTLTHMLTPHIPLNYTPLHPSLSLSFPQSVYKIAASDTYLAIAGPRISITILSLPDLVPLCELDNSNYKGTCCISI